MRTPRLLPALLLALLTGCGGGDAPAADPDAQDAPAPDPRTGVIRSTSIVVPGFGMITESTEVVWSSMVSFDDLPEPVDGPDSPWNDPAQGIRVVENPAGPVVAGTVGGFEGPESVLYDPDQDVWFVSSFTGNASERDGNGTVSLLDGETLQVRSLAWAEATEEHPFHSGRGMALQGDTLWVADLDGVHGFHRETGEQLVFVDLSSTEPGFLNDIGAQENGEVWVTDTGGDRVIQVRPEGGWAIELDGRTGNPNGILRSMMDQDWILAPWSGADSIWAWNPISDSRRLVAVSPGATRVDGLAQWWGGLILAGVQADSSIHVLDPQSGRGRSWISLPGAPADIGVDPYRQRLAVPYVARNEVQFWQLDVPAPRR